VSDHGVVVFLVLSVAFTFQCRWCQSGRRVRVDA
jgi:hypothetical protein